MFILGNLRIMNKYCYRRVLVVMVEVKGMKKKEQIMDWKELEDPLGGCFKILNEKYHCMKVFCYILNQLSLCCLII